jgi:uncharacterized protein DUF6457
MHAWLLESRERLAESVGEDASAYDLSETDITELLDLARVAARNSGEKTNAPLITYLVGVAIGRRAGRSLPVVANAARGSAAEGVAEPA